MEKSRCTCLHSPCDIHLLDHLHEDTIPMNTGSPKFAMQQAVRDSIAGNIQETEYLTYPPVTGEQAFHARVVEYYQQRHNISVSPEQVFTTSGAMQAVQNVCRIEAGRGEEVLLPPPFWFKFPDIVKAAGGTPVLLDTSAADDFRLTPNLLKKSLAEHPGARLLILTNPDNPTGVVYSRSELRALYEVAAAHPQLKILSDEVYNELLIESPEETCVSIGSFESRPERVYTINSMSKNFAMSGLRVGYLLAPQSSVDALRELQGLTTLGVNAALQSGATTALANNDDYTSEIARQLAPKLSLATKAFGAIPEVHFSKPAAGYYFFLNVSAYIGSTTPEGVLITDDVMLANYLELEGRVKVVPGSTCGVPDYFRITFAIEDKDIVAGAEAIARVFSTLETAQITGD